MFTAVSLCLLCDGWTSRENWTELKLSAHAHCFREKRAEVLTYLAACSVTARRGPGWTAVNIHHLLSRQASLERSLKETGWTSYSCQGSVKCSMIACVCVTRGWKCVYWTVTEPSSFLKVIYLSAPVPAFHTFTFKLELHLNPESVLGSGWWIAMELRKAISIIRDAVFNRRTLRRAEIKPIKTLNLFIIITSPFGAQTGDLIKF